MCSLVVQKYKKVDDARKKESRELKFSDTFSPRQIQILVTGISEIYKCDPDGPGIQFGAFIFFEHLVD